MRMLSRLFRLGAVFFLLALAGFGADLARAEGRVALVVGNSAYRNVPQLRNPANDATDVAASLERLGFRVDLLKDAGFDDLRRGLIAFGAKARGADMAVVFYAGHGMEVAGENWAIPVDASLASDADVENEAIGLKSLTLAVSGASGLGLVILDACRNNPFDARMQRTNRTRAMTRGLAPIEPTGNVMVAFAAKDGTTATDGDGRNSPFTGALLSHMETPGLEIDFLLRNVRDDVLAATNGQQQPFAYGSLSREAVYLKPAPPTPAGTPVAAVAPAADEVAWPYVVASSDAALVRRFTAQYPASRHRAEADQRLATLEAAAATPAPAPGIASASAPVAAAADTGGTTTADPKPAVQVADVSTPEQTAVARQFNGAAPQVEQAWSLIKTSGDPALLRRFTAEFPSRDRRIVSAALNGIGATTGVLRQLHAEEMHAVLADYGRFVQNARYGEVWVPGVTPPGWHPYEPCHWVKTRQFDWFYLDRTPWGAIVHHYGRWAHDDQLGWIWVPGVDFSPGWVVWQTTEQTVGWAPMPPAEDTRHITAAQFGKADFWTFMDRADFMRGCGATVPAGPLLQTATFVREIHITAGIPVFVLPLALPGAPLDIEVAFDPWPAWMLGQAMLDWNKVWALQAELCAIPVPAPLAPVKVDNAPPPLKAAVAPAAGAVGKAAGPAKINPQQKQVKKAPNPAPVARLPRWKRPAVVLDDPDDPTIYYRRRPSRYPASGADPYDSGDYGQVRILDRFNSSGRGSGAGSGSSSGNSAGGGSARGGSSSGGSAGGGSSAGGSSSGGSASGGTSGGGSTGGGSTGGGSTGGGGTGGGRTSDRRLKRRVRRIGASPSGLPLYEFEYIWGGPMMVGVMAQDLLVMCPEAVIVARGGYMQVNYDLIDVTMMTLEAWLQEKAAV